jgi:hypothetical protein
MPARIACNDASGLHPLLLGYASDGLGGPRQNTHTRGEEQDLHFRQVDCRFRLYRYRPRPPGPRLHPNRVLPSGVCRENVILCLYQCMALVADLLSDCAVDAIGRERIGRCIMQKLRISPSAGLKTLILFDKRN